MNNLPEIIVTIQNTISSKQLSVNKTLVESGVGKDFIANMKKGTIPSVNKFSDLADYLGCSVDYLLGRTDCPNMLQYDNDGKPIIVGTTESNDSAD